MPVNPYESPRTVSHDKRPREAVSVRASASVIVVALAGIVGGSLFIAILLTAQSNWFQAALPSGIAATLMVLLAADWYIQRQRPALGSAVIGFLLASPLALVVAFAFGLVAYGMATKNVPGAAIVASLSYGSFFLTISLGGWIAICRARRTAIPENQISN